METFIIEESTKNNIPVKLCGICKSGYKKNCMDSYSQKIRNHIFSDTKDEYLIDFQLAKFLIKDAPSQIYALGASILIKGVKLNSGGIIGDPHSISSAEDIVEDLGNNLYCIAFSGKFGAVFKSTEEKANNIFVEFKKLLQMSNEEIVPKAESLLSDSDLFIFVSDGSGKDSFFYVSDKS